jgi:hypothetical protein
VTRRRVQRRVRSARNKSSLDREFAGRIFVKDTAACIGKAMQVVQSVSGLTALHQRLKHVFKSWHLDWHLEFPQVPRVATRNSVVPGA